MAILPRRDGPVVRPLRQRVRFPVAASDVRYRAGVAKFIQLFDAGDRHEREREGLQNLGRVAGYRRQGHRRVGVRRHAHPQRRKAPGEGREGQKLSFLRARLRLVPAGVRAAGKRRSQQGRRRFLEGGADDHLAQDGGGPETDKENRSQIILIRRGQGGGRSRRLNFLAGASSATKIILPGCGVRRALTGNPIGIRRRARLVARIASGFRGIDLARYQQAPARGSTVKIVSLPAIGLGRDRWSRTGYGAAIFGTPRAGLAFPRVGRHLVRGAVASGTARRQTRAGPPALAAPDARPRRRSIKPLRLVRLVAVAKTPEVLWTETASVLTNESESQYHRVNFGSESMPA